MGNISVTPAAKAQAIEAVNKEATKEVIKEVAKQKNVEIPAEVVEKAAAKALEISKEACPKCAEPVKCPDPVKCPESTKCDDERGVWAKCVKDEAAKLCPKGESGDADCWKKAMGNFSDNAASLSKAEQACVKRLRA